jgi:hypothetical protein
MCRLPPLRQPPLQLAHWHGGHSSQRTAEVGFRVKAVAVGAGAAAVERGDSLAGMS